jgi:membrane-associated phospholipid phosphatase
VLVRERQEVQALPRRLTRALAVALAFALVGLVLLRLAYEHEPLAAIDDTVAKWAATSTPGWVEGVGRALSGVGGWRAITVLTVVALVLLVWKRAWVDAWFLLMAVVGSQIVVTLLKAWIDRSRPVAGPAVPLPESASFPSGHATTGIAVFGALAVLVSERLAPGRARTAFWVVAVFVGLGTGISRLMLNVHFISDVLAGWCFGLAWLSACLLARDALTRGARRPSFR